MNVPVMADKVHAIISVRTISVDIHASVEKDL